MTGKLAYCDVNQSLCTCPSSEFLEAEQHCVPACHGYWHRCGPSFPQTTEKNMFMKKTTYLLSLVNTLLMAGALTLTNATADTLEDVKASGELKVGVFSDFPPFSSASADMSLKGYDIDVADFLAASMGVKMVPVSVTGQNRIPYLKDGRVDLLMSVGYSDERAEVIDYAAAYAPYYIAVIGPAAMDISGPADLAGKSVSVNRGTLEDTSLTEAAPDNVDIKRFDNYNSVIQAFISGQTDLMVVGNDVGAGVLAKQEAIQPEQKFQLLTSPSHIAVGKGETTLQQAIDSAIATMLEDGKLNESSESWLNTPLNPENLKD